MPKHHQTVYTITEKLMYNLVYNIDMLNVRNEDKVQSNNLRIRKHMKVSKKISSFNFKSQKSIVQCVCVLFLQ